LQSSGPRFPPMHFDHPGSLGHRLEQFSCLFPNLPHPRAPVAEQFSGDPDVPTFVDALKHQPHLLGHARHTSFLANRLPFLGFLLCPVDPVLEDLPTRPLQPVPLPDVSPALRLPNLVACLHHTLGGRRTCRTLPGSSRGCRSLQPLV
jgi:hypothetical protein